jgi:serine/threonine protein kinase
VSDVSSAPGMLAAGSQVAGYTVEEQIGRGGMAVVYRAADARLNRSVALKILAPELANDTAYRQRFSREMRAAAAVDHPNIVPVFDAGEADGVLFIAMRYVSGQDVRTLLNAVHRLPADRVTHLISQAASALDEAHSRGLVHRDVKPGNMLIASVTGGDQPDHLYLSDFGLSKQRVSSAPLTLTGQFLGTLDYMAPEQVEGEALDGRADLYSLACTAFEMLAGEPPFKREQGIAVMWAQLQAAPPSLTALRPDLPPGVDQVIARAMAKSPTDRYQTCGAFADSLRTACGLGGSQVSPAASPVPPAGPAPTEMAQIQSPQPDPVASWARDRAPDPDMSWADPLYRPAASAPPGPAGGSPPSASGSPGSASGPSAPPASWPPPPPMSTGYRPAGPPTPRRRRAWPLLVGCIVLLAIVGVAFALLRSKPSSSTPPPPPSSPATSTKTATAPPVAGPAATVQAYIAAINDHDYARAWALGGKNTGSSFSAFSNGFNGTAKDNLTVVSVSGGVVTVKLAAVQTDGTVKNFQGTYTVTNGVITQSHIQPVA